MLFPLLVPAATSDGMTIGTKPHSIAQIIHSIAQKSSRLVYMHVTYAVIVHRSY